MKHRGFQLSANVSLLYAELPYLERFAAAARDGFAAVETWWPFASAAPNPADLDAFISLITRSGVELRGLNFYGGDLAGGERGIACRPERRAQLDANIDAVLELARRTGCRRFNLLYGQVHTESDAVAQQNAAINAYRSAAAALAAVDGVALVEPLARGLNGSYPLETHHDVIALLTGPLADVSNIGLLFDTFHLGMNGMNLPEAALEAAPWIRHVQVADAPGRGEPGSGHLPWEAVFDALQQGRYDGLVAAEYKPSTARTSDTLTWVHA